MLVFGIVAPVTLSVWALWPLPPVEPINPSITAPMPDDEVPEGLVPFDRTAFAALVWNPEPAPELSSSTVAGRERAAPSVRLQLIGIVHDTDEEGLTILRAALYDPGTDTLHIVASGEVIGGITVSLIDDEGVALESSGHTSRLALRDDLVGGGQR